MAAVGRVTFCGERRASPAARWPGWLGTTWLLGWPRKSRQRLGDGSWQGYKILNLLIFAIFSAKLLVACATFAISRLEPPFDVVMPGCPFGIKSDHTDKSAQRRANQRRENYARIYREGENRVHMQVTVFENASTASRYVDEKVLSLNRRRSIGYDSEDRESVPFEHSSSFVRRVAPPETDRLITYNIEDLLTGEEPSFSEGVIYRVGRYVGTVESTQQPPQYSVRGMFIEKKYKAAKGQFDFSRAHA